MDSGYDTYCAFCGEAVGAVKDSMGWKGKKIPCLAARLVEGNEEKIVCLVCAQKIVGQAIARSYAVTLLVYAANSIYTTFKATDFNETIEFEVVRFRQTSAGVSFWIQDAEHALWYGHCHGKELSNFAWGQFPVTFKRLKSLPPWAKEKPFYTVLPPHAGCAVEVTSLCKI